jgi:hypothetical protein
MAASGKRGPIGFGLAALIAGLLSAFGSFMIYSTSVWFDPPGWGAALAGLVLFIYAINVLG